MTKSPPNPIRPRVLLAAVAALALPGAALAHHGWSSYDAGTVLTIEAPILTAKYQNPHGEIEMTDKAGKRWQIVLAPPSRMEARGLPREQLAVGAVATVVGYPSRTQPAEIRAERITLAGKTVELR
jgi:hypothetical protein